MKLKTLDLFSGIGGFSLGLERTGGFETVAFCEIEPFPRAVLRKHWPDVRQYEDVRTLTADQLVRDGIGRVDVITGGFPCQDLSVAGLQAGIGEGTRSGLWSEIVRLSGELRPSYIIVENVANLLSGPSERPGAWFGRVLADLAALGYDAEWHCIPGSFVGAPHIRDRVWIIAYDRKERTQGIVAQTIRRVEAFSWCKDFRRAEDFRERSDLYDSPLCGSYNGIPQGSHRVAACGNAVVPAIPELIGRAILEFENAKT